MAKNNNFNVRVQTKRDTSSNWTRLNPILLDGEIIIVDTAEGDVRLKVGNGTSVYTALPFLDEYIDFPIPDVSGQIAIHNEDENSHQDIRASVIQALADAKEYTDDIIENFGSGVIISPDEPTNGDVWIDTDEVIEIEESGIVLSFNGRDGDVLPKDGDYTAEMVGADKAGAADAALADAKAYTDAQIATIPTPDVSGQISVHNEDENSHQDIRISVTQALTDAKEYTDDAIENIGPGVAVSAEEPTEENIWIDIDDNPDDEYDVVLTFNGRVGEIVPQSGDYTAEMVGAAEKTHASQHASGGSDPITPAAINALNKAGDTMIGTSLGLGDGYGEVRIHGSAAFIRTRNVKNDDNNSRYLAVFNPTHTSDIAKAVRLTNVDAEGNEAHYYILHTGNFSNYALNKAGDTMTGSLIAHTATDYSTYRMRNVAILSATPGTMNNGDIALVYS